REREREAARQEELVSHRRRERRRRDERARRDIARAERRFEDDQFKVDEIVQADEEVLVDEDVRHQIDLFDDKVLEDREASEIKEELPPMRKEDELKAPEREREREAARQEELVSHRRRERRRRDERARRDIARAERRFEDDQFKVDEIVQADEEVLVDEDVRHQIDLFDDKVLEDREASEIEEDLPPMRKEDELKAPEREREREAARQEELVSHRRRERRRRDERARREIARAERRFKEDQLKVDQIDQADKQVDEDVRHQLDLIDDAELEDREDSDVEEDLPPMRKEDELKAPEREREREAARQEELVSHRRRERRRRDERARRDIARAERRFEDDQFKVDEIVQADEEVLVDEDVRHQIDLFDDKVLEDREASEIEEDLPPMRKEDELKAPEREREREAARQEELVSHRRRERRRRDERARRDIARAERRFEDDEFDVDEIVQADKQVDEDVRHQIDLFDDKVLEDREASEIEEDLPPMGEEDELKAPERERQREAARQEELVSHRRRERRRRDERARREIARAERRFKEDQLKVDQIDQADKQVDEDVRHQLDLIDDAELEAREASEIEEDLPPMRKEDELKAPEREREREAARQEELVSHRRRERRRRDERARRDIARAERRFEDDEFEVDEIFQADKQVDEDVRRQIDLFDDKVLEDREDSEIEEDLPSLGKEDELKAPEREREREAARQEELVSHRRRERRRRDERARRDIARAERRFEDDEFEVDEIVQADKQVDEDVRRQIDLFDDKVLEDREASEIEEDLPPMRKEDELKAPEREREREAARQEELVSHRRRERRRRDERARRDIARAERRFEDDEFEVDEIVQADKQVDEDVRRQIDLFDDKVLEDREASEIEEDLPSLGKEDELKAPEREREREAARQEELVSHRRRERRRRDERARRDIARAERRFEDDQFKVDEIVQADEEVLVDEEVRHQIDLFDDKVLEDREASEIEEELPSLCKEDDLKAPEREREREAMRLEELVSHRRRERRRRDERARRDIARAERRFKEDQLKFVEIDQADKQVDEDVRHQLDLLDGAGCLKERNIFAASRMTVRFLDVVNELRFLLDVICNPEVDVLSDGFESSEFFDGSSSVSFSQLCLDVQEDGYSADRSMSISRRAFWRGSSDESTLFSTGSFCSVSVFERPASVERLSSKRWRSRSVDRAISPYRSIRNLSDFDGESWLRVQQRFPIPKKIRVNSDKLSERSRESTKCWPIWFADSENSDEAGADADDSGSGDVKAVVEKTGAGADEAAAGANKAGAASGSKTSFSERAPMVSTISALSDADQSQLLGRIVFSQFRGATSVDWAQLESQMERAMRYLEGKIREVHASNDASTDADSVSTASVRKDERPAEYDWDARARWLLDNWTRPELADCGALRLLLGRIIVSQFVARPAQPWSTLRENLAPPPPSPSAAWPDSSDPSLKSESSKVSTGGVCCGSRRGKR
ncbi:hypothetical protein BOX15_Mlig002929g1, partial [Macrostomum lignano]